MSELLEELRDVEPARRFDSIYMLLRRKYTEEHKPLSGTFELTSHCTLNCKMCYVHPSEGKDNTPVLETESWIGVMREAIEAGMLYATLTGGECFTHPGFKEIYEFLCDNGVSVSIITNGTMIDEAVANWFSIRKPQCVYITLYGSTPEVYERVTGSASAFEKANRAVTLLTERRVNVDIKITAIKQNADDVDAIIALARSRPVGRVMIESQIIDPRPGVSNDTLNCSLDFDMRIEMWRRNFEGLHVPIRECFDLEILASRMPHLDLETKKLLEGMPCAAGMCSFNVDCNGIMRPCVEYPLISVDLLGMGFACAWKAVNDAAHAYRRSGECRNCSFLGQCNFCPSRYALATGGYGHPEDRPCNIKDFTIPLMLASYEKEDVHEEEVF